MRILIAVISIGRNYYPAWSGHFGARVAMAPDGKLMVATGDGAQFKNAQDPESPNGKILRFNIDGTLPDDNPIAGSPVWARGLRNPQGLAFSSRGVLYNSDHGDATDDEVNEIVPEGNYGWPYVEGYVDNESESSFTNSRDIKEPLVAWTPTVAPAGMAVYESDGIAAFKNSLLLTTLKGNSLRVLRLNEGGDQVVADSVLFRQVFGRLRSVCVAPNGDVYIGTSNRDWNPHGFPAEKDDRILRISNVESAAGRHVLSAVVGDPGDDVVSRGESLYQDYCASCHRIDGRGLEGVFPPLHKVPVVTAVDKGPLIDLVLAGKNEMPAFGFLSDEELAIVLSYVRKRFGPQASRVAVSDVERQRKTGTD
jgi:mono/diheme cytochrome c family protein